jgi:hypothetical protein
MTTQWFFADGRSYEGQAPTGDAATATISYIDTCPRCNGSGRYPSIAWEGKCLKCNTAGRVKITARIFTSEALSRLQASKQKRQAAKEAKRQAERAAKVAALEETKAQFTAQNPGLIENLRSHTDSFATSLVEQFDRKGTLTAAQIAAGQRKIDQIANELPSAHLGTVGERREFTLTVTFTKLSEGRFCSTFIAFKDSAGNRVTWKASGCSALQAGDVVTGLATVKEHYEYQGKKQTAITRAQFSLKRE